MKPLKGDDPDQWRGLRGVEESTFVWSVDDIGVMKERKG
jgi:hypothetical protein